MLVALAALALAPSPGTAVDHLSARFDANALGVTLTNVGTLGNVSGDPPGFEWPRGSGMNVGYVGGLWVGAMIVGATHVTVAEYSSEWAPGPLDGAGMPVDPDANDPAHRVYAIRPGDNATNNRDYAEWPAALGAPVDGQGFPLLAGDQTLWAVFNDVVPARHTNPVGASAPLGLEVRQTAWGYARGDALDRVLFIAWEIENKGSDLLQNAYVAPWFDVDLGGGADDLVGCDAPLDLGFTYKGGNDDMVYGGYPPAFGCALLQGPIVNGDTLGMHAFGRLLKNYSEPMDRDDAYWRMENGLWDQPLDPIYANCNSPGTRYEVDGDPVSGAGCLDEHPADRRMMWSTGPFDLPPGGQQRVVVAVIVGGQFGVTSRLLSVWDLRLRAEAARAAFFDPPPPPAIEPAALARVTPNPGGGTQSFALRVAPPSGAVSVRIHDLAGRLVWSREVTGLAPGLQRIEWNGRDNDGRRAPGAVYLARVRDADGERGIKLVRLP
jgi:hypothetical protein